MATHFWVEISTGVFLGAFGDGVEPDTPAGSRQTVPSAPINATAIWNGTSWDEPWVYPPNITKLKIKKGAADMATLKAANPTLFLTVPDDFWGTPITGLKAYIEADADRLEDWGLAVEINTADPLLQTAKSAYGWSEEEYAKFVNHCETKGA